MGLESEIGFHRRFLMGFELEIGFYVKYLWVLNDGVGFRFDEFNSCLF